MGGLAWKLEQEARALLAAASTPPAPQHAGNARLIAAVPDPLEAALDALNGLDNLMGDTDPHEEMRELLACQKLSAAIAKATGQA